MKFAKFFRSDFFVEYLRIAASVRFICGIQLWNYVELCREANFPAGNYIFKVNNRNTRPRCEICSKVTIKTPEQHKLLRSGVVIVNVM